MIDLHYSTTPNGLKVKLFLEEAAIPYRGVLLSLNRGDQFKPEFTALSPNNRIPAIVDHDPPGGGAPLSMFESGAIMLYLAEKTGRLIVMIERGNGNTGLRQMAQNIHKRQLPNLMAASAHGFLGSLERLRFGKLHQDHRCRLAAIGHGEMDTEVASIRSVTSQRRKSREPGVKGQLRPNGVSNEPLIGWSERRRRRHRVGRTHTVAHYT